MTAIVDTPEQAAALDLPPLLVRRPLEAFLDTRGLGAGPVEAEPVGEGHSTARSDPARGRGMGAATPAAPATATVGP